MISIYDPPTYVQLILAFGGSFVCLIGVVFLFAEGQSLTKDRGKTARKAG
jgi:hypothetical protein